MSTALVLVFGDKNRRIGLYTWPEEGDVDINSVTEAELAHFANHINEKRFRGWLYGSGNLAVTSEWNTPDNKWLILEVDSSDISTDDYSEGSHVRFSKGKVRFVGSRENATSILNFANSDRTKYISAFNNVEGAVAVVGFGAKATSHKRHGIALASRQNSEAEVTADFGIAIANCGKAKTGRLGFSYASMNLAESGERAISVTDNGQAKSGNNGVSAALSNIGVGGYDGTTTSAGVGGTIIMVYMDTDRRNRVVVGYVGENGIKPDTTYIVQNGVLTEL